jgi:hypothetical protein
MSNNRNGKNEKTKDEVGDKGVSNSTGHNNGKDLDNEDNPYNLTGKAFEDWKLNEEFIAKKNRYITSTNFGDKPRTFLFNAEKIESSEIEDFLIIKIIGNLTITKQRLASELDNYGVVPTDMICDS